MLKKRKICIKIFIVSFSLILILFSGVSIVRPRDISSCTRSWTLLYGALNEVGVVAMCEYSRFHVEVVIKKRLARFEHCEEAWRGLTMQMY